MDLQRLRVDGRFERFAEVARTVFGRRSIFATTSDHIGLGSGALEIGDVVYTLSSATMLHVLRSISVGCGLIGDCFIDGLMDGEIITMLHDVALSRGPATISGSVEPAPENVLEVGSVTLV
jgi:hypothetical protein